MWKTICQFAELVTPPVLVVSAMIGTAFATPPILWAFKTWFLYWCPDWF